MRTADRMAALDRAVAQESQRMTVGMASVHAMTPAEIVEQMEEEAFRASDQGDRERMACRVEVMAGLMGYLLAEGPHPARVRERMEGALRSFCPELLARMSGEEMWWQERDVADVLGRHAATLRAARSVAQGRGALSEWWDELRDDPDMETVVETLSGLLAYWLSEGTKWRLVTSVTLCIAKALCPHLIGHMSLEEIAVLSGDAGGRATPSHRIRRLYNHRIEAAGMLGSYVHFQKSPTTCARYAASQIGNQNRKKNHARKGH